MEFVFRDLVTKCWWSWASLFVCVLLGTVLAISPSLTEAGRGWIAIATYLSLCLFFAAPLLRAAYAGHRHLLTVCVWSFVLVILGIALSFFAFYSFAGTNSTKYDKLLNVVPVFVAIWAAALGWFIHFRLSTKAHRTNNAFAIIMEMRKSAEYLKRSELVTKHFPPGTNSIPVAYDEFFAGDAIRNLHAAALDNEAVVCPNELERAEAMQALKYVLNYFEFMSVGIKAGDLDEDLLYDTISTTVIKLFDRAARVIDYVRMDMPAGAGQPLAFIAAADLAARWKVRQNLEIANR